MVQYKCYERYNSLVIGSSTFGLQMYDGLSLGVVGLCFPVGCSLVSFNQFAWVYIQRDRCYSIGIKKIRVWNVMKRVSNMKW